MELWSCGGVELYMCGVVELQSCVGVDCICVEWWRCGVV